MCGSQNCKAGRVWNYDPKSGLLKQFRVYRHASEYPEYEMFYDASGRPCRTIRRTFDDQRKEVARTDSWLTDARSCD